VTRCINTKPPSFSLDPTGGCRDGSGGGGLGGCPKLGWCIVGENGGGTYVSGGEGRGSRGSVGAAIALKDASATSW